MSDDQQTSIEIRHIDGQRAPVVRGVGETLADLVRAAHEVPIEETLARYTAEANINRDGLDRILIYCAERKCIEEQATCPGCRRRSQALGLVKIEDFIAAHSAVEIGDKDLSIPGRGESVVCFDTFEDFYRHWAGEEYWFWARRVLRKLRHGIRRAHIQGEPVAGDGETPSVILVEPQLADNIGMVARAMANFGLDDLRLVAPRDGWPNERARIAASGANYIIDDSQCYPSLSEAMGDLNWMCATTARQRDLRKPVLTPEMAVREMARRIAEGQRCGVLFGREASGLTTPEVAEADALVMIPVNSKFASLNLAQSVLILGYAWILSSGGGSLGRVTTYERPIEPGFQYGKDTPGKKAELEGFFEQLEAGLDTVNFFRPPERRAITVRAIRTMFQRMNATSHELRTLRGVIAALAKGGKSRDSDV